MRSAMPGGTRRLRLLNIPKNRWLTAAIASAIVLVVVSLYLHFSGCPQYWPRKAIWFVAGIPPLLAFLFLGLRWKWRFVLAACALFVALFILPPHINPTP